MLKLLIAYLTIISTLLQIQASGEYDKGAPSTTLDQALRSSGQTLLASVDLDMEQGISSETTLGYDTTNDDNISVPVTNDDNTSVPVTNEPTSVPVRNLNGTDNSIPVAIIVSCGIVLCAFAYVCYPRKRAIEKSTKVSKSTSGNTLNLKLNF